MKALIYISDIGQSWKDFVLKPVVHIQSARIVVAKLLFGASVCFKWQERNNRLFLKKSRQVEQVFDIIFATTRIQMMTLKFKDSDYVDCLKTEWNLGSYN